MSSEKAQFSLEHSKHALTEAHLRGCQLANEVEQMMLLDRLQQEKSIVRILYRFIDKIRGKTVGKYALVDNQRSTLDEHEDGIELCIINEDQESVSTSIQVGIVRNSILSKESKLGKTPSHSKNIQFDQDSLEMESMSVQRLTLAEKQQLYTLRPDLRIIPNWAHKYRKEMGSLTTTTFNWHFIICILCLSALLVALIILIIITKAQTQ